MSTTGEGEGGSMRKRRYAGARSICVRNLPDHLTHGSQSYGLPISPIKRADICRIDKFVVLNPRQHKLRDKKALNESRKVQDQMFVKLCISIKTHNRDHLTSACMILWFAHNYNNTVGMGTVVLFCTLVLRQFCDDLPRKKCVQYRHYQ